MSRSHLFVLLLLLAVVVPPCLIAAQEHAPAKNAEAKAESKGEKHQGEGEHGDSRQFIWKIVNFVAFFGLLIYFLRKPATEFFTSRTASIQREMQEAKAAREQAEKRLAEIEQKLNSLGDEIATLKSSAAQEDAVTADRMRQATEAEAAKILTSAEADISTMARAARLELKSYTSQLAVELAKERIKKEMTPETQERLLRHYVTDLGDGGKGGSN